MSDATVTEAEVVSIFLRAEIDSPRFREHILNALKQAGRDTSIIERPDLGNANENAIRAKILGAYRGYGENKFLFFKFPRNVQ